MSDHPDISNDKNPAGEDDVPQTKKTNTFVNSAALIIEDKAIPIYAVLQSQSKQLVSAWVWVVATAVFCSWAISFTYAVFISDKPLPRAYDWSPSTTIQLVNITSHVAVLLTSALIGAIFDALCWSLASRSKGATLGTFLATQKSSDLMGVGKLFLNFGSHWKWCIMRYTIAGVGWVVGLLLLAHVTTEKVYSIENTFPVIAGIADFHTSVLALEKANVLTTTNESTSSFQETSINMMILGTTRSILTDPTFVIDVPPQRCKAGDCKSIFLPGGLELVRQPDGSALNLGGKSPQDSVIIVHDAPGYQLEYSSSNYSFNRDTDCSLTGFAVSSFYFCVVFTGENIVSSFSICPFDQMSKGTCESDPSWTETLDATVSMALYKRIATVAYDKSNFSILSIESISDATNAAHENLVADFQKMFSIMYPQLSNIIADIEGLFGDFNSIWTDLAYWASVYCVQSELASAQWLYDNGFPTWITGKQDILEGLMTIPIQFGTLLWQFVDIKSLLPALTTTASSARVSYRVRSELWPIALFAGLVLGLIVWAIICLLYVHFSGHGKADQELSPVVQAAFDHGNPFDVDDKGFWETLWALVGRMWGKPSQTKADDQVVARTLSNKFLIAVDRSEG